MTTGRALLAMAAFWIAAVLASCSAAPETPAEMYQGTMASGCAPHDAPSTVLELESMDGARRVSLNLWPPAGLVPPTTVEFDPQHPIGLGTLCLGPACESAAWGEVRLESPGPRGDVEGEWTLGLAEERTYRCRFTADWLTIQALCG